MKIIKEGERQVTDQEEINIYIPSKGFAIRMDKEVPQTDDKKHNLK